jgi:NAD(P)-dependent dehydrogenase (short-subunit alcohol dehydrogenase family)
LDDAFGRIDVMVNIPGNNILGHPEDITVAHLRQVLEGTLVSKFICCQEAGRRMLQQGRGSIINMSSIGGMRALGRGNFAYDIGQAGVIAMTRDLSVEWAGRGVRVNANAPTQITSGGFEQRMDNSPGPRETFLRGIPAGRLGVPDDIQGLVMFLAADASGFMTGTVFPLDGSNIAMNANDSIGRTQA